MSALLCAVALALTACAHPEVADHHRPANAPKKATVAGHPSMPGADLPDPGRVEMDGTALERYQNGWIMAR